MAASSTADTEKVSLECRMLAAYLTAKPFRSGSDLESHLKEKTIKRVADVAKTLLKDTSKIDRIEIVLSGSGQHILKKKATAEQEMEQACFDPSSVRKLGDLPAPWVWGWLRQVCTYHPPSYEVIRAMSSNTTNVKHLRQVATGLPDTFVLDDDLIEKTTLSEYMTHCHVLRGSPLAKLDLSHFLSDWIVVFSGALGCFRFEAQVGSTRAQFLIHSGTVGDHRRIDIIERYPELQVTVDTAIANNQDDYSASIHIAKQKVLLYTFFDHLKKPNREDAYTHATEWCAEWKKKSAKAPTVAKDLLQAAKRRRSLTGGAPSTPVSM